MKELVDIIINNFQRLQYLETLVKEINIRTEYPFKIIVVDNGSTKRTREFIQELLKKKLIQKVVYNEKNLVLPQSFKKGFELVESKYCIVTVDDTIPPWTNPCWLTHLVYLIENCREFGAISLGYSYAWFKDYSSNKIERIKAALNKDNVRERHAVEEFFRIQKTEDLKVVGFSDRNVGIYDFAKKMTGMLGKKIGITMKESNVLATAWRRDENNGYPKSVKNMYKFDYE